MNYRIISNEDALDSFIDFLPDTLEQEVYYLCLMGRHKYCPDFPNTKDAGQLARITARKSELKEKIRRLECPVGCYTRDGVIAPQECLALYIGLNPRSLVRANRNLLVTLAKRIADGDLNFNPLSVTTTEIHRATDRKFFVDFDYDDADPKDYLNKIMDALPMDAYRILKTRGGFHVIVILENAKNAGNWYKALTALPKCDVKGANNLTPVPGCIQGGHVPCFV